MGNVANVAETIHTRALARAAEIEGSTQALASLLRVPHNTLLRWMSGRAQMPLRAFLHTIRLLVQHEVGGHGAPSLQEVASGEKLNFRVGELTGRCVRCGDTGFMLAEPGTTLRFTSKLACCGCGETVVHGDLVARLSKDAVYHPRAPSATRARRPANATDNESR